MELGKTADEGAELSILHVAVRPSVAPSDPRRVARRQSRCALFDVILRDVGCEGGVELGLEEGEEEVEEVDSAFVLRVSGDKEDEGGGAYPRP